jgi:hypothetical protein
LIIQALADILLLMSKTVVVLYIPLMPTLGLPEREYEFPWIEDVENFLDDVDWDQESDGEEDAGVNCYTFFLEGKKTDELLALASQISQLPRVPSGCYALVTTEEVLTGEEDGVEKRFDLPLA